MQKITSKSSVFALAIFVMAVALAICATPAQAMADEIMAHSYDDSGNRFEYKTTDEAITAGYSGKVIYLDVDWMFTGTMTVADSKSLTIDMNGHKITSQEGGTVIRVYENASLTLQSSETKTFDYKGYSSVDSGRYDMTIEAGGLITGGKTEATKNSVGGICLDNNSSLTLDNVAVAGNCGKTVGGIFAKSDCTITMRNNAKVCHNLGKTGGIAFYKTDCNMSMVNSSIEHNYGEGEAGGIYSNADGTRISMLAGSSISYNSGKDAGGAAFNYSYFNIISTDKTGKIDHNTSRDGNGGGIAVYEKTAAKNEGMFQGLTITDNEANGNGGAMSLTQRWTRVIDCTIQGNSCQGCGGGIYINGNNNSVENCTITKNTAGKNSQGGGIFLVHNNDLTLSGKCQITNNVRQGDSVDDDVFLEKNDGVRSFIKSGVTYGSHVGIRTANVGSAQIGKKITAYVDDVYFMDMSGYHVSAQAGSNDTISLFQEEGDAKYYASVNSVATGTFKTGETVTANGASTQAGKHFWYWDVEKSYGLDPITDYITDETKYNSVLTYKMQHAHVNLFTVDVDCATQASVKIHKPVAGEALPTTAVFKPSNDDDSSKDYVDVAVTWYEVASDGTKTVAAGTAGYGKTYVASITVDPDKKNGIFYSASMKASDVKVDTVGEGTVDAAAVSVSNVTEALNITTAEYKTQGNVADTVQPAKVSVTVGTSARMLEKTFPSTAVVTLKGGGEAVVPVDTSGQINWPEGLLNGNNFVEPTAGTGPYVVSLPLGTSSEVDGLQNKYIQVTIEVIEAEKVATPVLSPEFGTYNRYTGGTKLDSDLKMKVYASCSTDGASMYYKLDGGEKRSYYESEGIELVGLDDQKTSHTLEVWAVKQVGGVTVSSEVASGTYYLDDTLNKTITVNCSDTALYGKDDDPWADYFKVTGTLGGEVSITAPEQTNRVFDHWKWDDAPEGIDLSSATLTIKDFSYDYDGKITAVYKPVITKIDVDIAVPTAHQKLADSASAIKVTAGEESSVFDLTSYFAKDGKVAVTWLPSAEEDGTAAHSTIYNAVISLDPTTDFPEGVDYEIAEDLELLVNGAASSGSAYILDEGGAENLYVGFPSTGGYTYKSMESVSEVGLTFMEACSYQAEQDAQEGSVDWDLSSEVQITYACGDTDYVDINWDKVTGFDSAKLAEQTLTATGTIVYPDDVDTTAAPKTVTTKINVAAPQTAAKPTSTLDSGEYPSAQVAELDCENEDADIYYTLDGTEPTKQSQRYYWDEIDIEPTAESSEVTLKARAYVDGMIASEVAEYTYTIKKQTVATPNASEESGVFKTSCTVSLSCKTAGATILFTTDGTDPSTSGTAQTYIDGNPLSIGESCTLRMVATCDGMANSNEASYTYVIEPERVAKPAAMPAPGEYSEPVSVTITSATEGAQIRYTTNGEDPDENSPVYDGDPIVVSASTTIKARAYCDGMPSSDIAEFAYTIAPKTYVVTFDSAGGSDVESQKVSDGATVVKPANPTRAGYTFAYWELNGAEYDFASAVTGDITLTAKWTEDASGSGTSSDGANEGSATAAAAMAATGDASCRLALVAAASAIVAAAFVVAGLALRRRKN